MPAIFTFTLNLTERHGIVNGLNFYDNMQPNSLILMFTVLMHGQIKVKNWMYMVII